MADSVNAAAQTPFLIRILKYWLPVAVTLGVMYYLSTDTFSSDNTHGVVENIFLWFFPHASERTMEVLNYLIRKSAHFTEYAILGALLFWAFRADSGLRWRFRWAVFSLASAVSWAALDELHQTFTRARSGSIWDSLLDSSGALFSLVTIAMFSIKRRAPRSS